MNIFLITTIREGALSGINLTPQIRIPKLRAVGWFQKFEDAEKTLEHNTFDLFEGIYDFAVIEEIPEGCYSFVENDWWYRFNKENKKYESIERPDEFRGIRNFSIG